tara:strand:+ start:95 stop:835 length:741 start_codon:yes stop_codon:yes gene_type:complete
MGGPWNPSVKEKVANESSPFGCGLWFVALWVGGFLLWTLFHYFPDRITHAEAPSLTKLLLILMFLSLVLFSFRKHDMKKAVRNALVWFIIFVCLAVSYTFRHDVTNTFNRVFAEFIPGYVWVRDNSSILVSVAQDGHYYVTGVAHGKKIRFLVDTGASDIVLNHRDAKELGIDVKNLQFSQIYQTANGRVRGAPYLLESLRIGSFQFLKVWISVNEAKMGTSLLGMSFLERFDSYKFYDGKLQLRL